MCSNIYPSGTNLSFGNRKTSAEHGGGAYSHAFPGFEFLHGWRVNGDVVNLGMWHLLCFPIWYLEYFLYWVDTTLLLSKFLSFITATYFSYHNKAIRLNHCKSTFHYHTSSSVFSVTGNQQHVTLNTISAQKDSHCDPRNHWMAPATINVLNWAV